MVPMLALGFITITRGWRQMAKYFYGFDILQEIMIAIPVEGSIIYPDLTAANKTTADTAKQQRKEVVQIMKWLQEKKAPTNMMNFIGSMLGSRIDKMWDYNNAEIMINNNGVLYTLKDMKIIDGIEEILKMKKAESK